MDINYFVSMLQPYWGIIASGFGFGVYAFFHWQNAKKIILSVMLQLEKEAETLVLSTGEAKFQFVVDKGYQLLPLGARFFITPAMFDTLAQSLYDQTKEYLLKYIPEAPATPVPSVANVKKDVDQETA